MSATIYKMHKGKVCNIQSDSKQELFPCESFMIPEVKLSYSHHLKPEDRPCIKGSNDAYTLLLKTWDSNKIELQEQFKILLLNRANHVLGMYELSTGGVTSTLVDPKLIFAVALKANACALITAHNHPSGSLKPSETDKYITRKIKEGALLLDMVLLDHLIITPYSYYSFAGEEMM